MDENNVPVSGKAATNITITENANNEYYYGEVAIMTNNTNYMESGADGVI